MQSAAICAPPLGSIHVEGEIPQDPRATVAKHTCSGNNWVRGIGDGGGLIDGGPVFLLALAPVGNPPKGMRVVLSAPLRPEIGGMVAHLSCALGF